MTAREAYSNDSAMTEVALALAMAFFSILVLTLVSMGTGRSVEAGAPSAETRAIAAALVPAAPEDAPAAESPGPNDVLVVFHAGTFFDSSLSPLSDAALAGLNDGTGEGRVILAVSPSLPMEAAMAARAKLAGANLAVTTLNQDWLNRLAGQ